MWFLYIAECADKSLYTGITTDPKRREKTHNSGKGAKSVLGKLPVRIIYLEKYKTYQLAAKREFAIKNWTRLNKLKLIMNSSAKIKGLTP